MRVLLHTKPTAATTTGDGPSPGVAKQAGRFALHYLQMCVAMGVSLFFLGLLAAWAGAAVGLADPRESAPVLAAVVVTLTLSGSMVAWMRFMNMPWRPTLEMVIATLFAGVVLVIGYSIGRVSATEMVAGLCPLACMAMLAVMLPRFRMYASHSSRHLHGT